MSTSEEALMPDENCLHCAVMAMVNEWFDRHGEHRAPDGQIMIDGLVAISKLTECIVQITQMAPERSQRRRGFRFAHDALDANLKSVQTGKLVPLEFPAEH